MKGKERDERVSEVWCTDSGDRLDVLAVQWTQAADRGGDREGAARASSALGGGRGRDVRGGLYRSTGRLLYDPQHDRLGCGPWWCILDACDELLRFYRYQAQREDRVILQAPAWGAHVSVVRGETVPKPAAWGKYAGEEIEFSYDPEIGWGNNTVYWWLDVQCPRLEDIREELGLPRKPPYRLHLTLGKKIGEVVKLKDFTK
jgi:hypothetical protein